MGYVLAGRFKGASGWMGAPNRDRLPAGMHAIPGESRFVTRARVCVCVRVFVILCRMRRSLLLDVLLDERADGGCELVLEAFRDRGCECGGRTSRKHCVSLGLFAMDTR